MVILLQLYDCRTFFTFSSLEKVNRNCPSIYEILMDRQSPMRPFILELYSHYSFIKSTECLFVCATRDLTNVLLTDKFLLYNLDSQVRFGGRVPPPSKEKSVLKNYHPKKN